MRNWLSPLLVQLDFQLTSPGVEMPTLNPPPFCSIPTHSLTSIDVHHLPPPCLSNHLHTYTPPQICQADCLLARAAESSAVPHLHSSSPHLFQIQDILLFSIFGKCLFQGRRCAGRSPKKEVNAQPNTCLPVGGLLPSSLQL